METIKNNPLNTVLVIITVLTNIWNLLTENAELFGIGSKAISIGAIVLTAIKLVYDALKSNTNA